MSSTRLTQATRDFIVNAVSAKRFNPQVKLLEARKTKLADAIYAAVYKDWAAKMWEAPLEWFHRDQCLRCHFNGKYDNLHMSKERPFPNNRRSTDFGYNSPHTVEWNQIQADEEAMEHARQSAKQMARAVLNSCRTVEQLLKQWPEVKPFLPKDLSAPMTTALTVPMSTLNAMLGLTVGEN
jgi:hypothetical protein